MKLLLAASLLIALLIGCIDSGAKAYADEGERWNPPQETQNLE